MSTLLFLDSFDHYSSEQRTRKWTIWEFGVIKAGRNGNGGGVSGISQAIKTFGPEYTQLTMGVAYKTASLGNEILRFQNVRNSIGAEVRHVSDGRLQFQWQAKGSTFTEEPSTFVMTTNRWYYVEMQVTVSDDGEDVSFSGTARVNEDEILSDAHTFDFLTPLPFSANFATVRLGGPGGGFSATVDDLYVTDDEYLGDIAIAVLYPDGLGDNEEWTPSNPGDDNWEHCEETPADDDTTYVTADAVDELDFYNIDDVGPFVGTIKGAQALWCVKKSDMGTGAVKGQWKSGVTVSEQPNAFYPSALEYLYARQAERKSLFTAADWTPAEVDAIQQGLKRTL
jgi:hypothetical protein